MAAAVRERLDEERKKLTDKFEKEDCCIVFDFSDEEEYYFKFIFIKDYGENYYSEKYYVHTGMFQDSVLIENVYPKLHDEDELDYRFFPYAGNRLEFYSFVPFEGRIYIKNSGKEVLEVDTPIGNYLIPAGERYRIAADALLGRTTEHMGPDVDKHNVWDAVIDKNGMVGYKTPGE